MANANQNSAYKERNLEFLEEYAQRPGVTVMFNGVMYRQLVKGKGDKPQPKSFVTVHYTGKLINGKVFDSTAQGGPATFRLNQLIDGWRTALCEMPVGSRWEIVIPFNLGYGAKGAGAIKPFSTLIFDVRLIAIG
ncbi:MAG: FKBP-type peptidyl-prolyl cis-trans isomerase [Tidjanibacter sp.]|nr:FKBP-type peptidyl-prolyl cis-trans isomerase [Tidjanibacter sp.]